MLTSVPPPSVVTFDCFGTLVEWDAVLLPAISNLLRQHGRQELRPEPLLAAFHHLSFAAQDGPVYRSYADIVRGSFRLAFAQAGLVVSDDETDAMVRALRTARPHADVLPALARLKSHCRIGLITNSDDDIVGPCIERLGVAVDFVATAALAKAYKPSPRIFDIADRLAGVPGERMVHVAMSMVLDISACVERGRCCVWINRRGLKTPQPYRANAVLPSLEALPRWLGLP